MDKILANVVCDISKHTEEEIFGKNSIRDHAVEDSKNPNAPGYQKFTITGSQAGVVMGLSHWQSPLTLWATKTGLLEPERLTGDCLSDGHRAEEYVAQTFREKMLREVDTLEDIEIIDDTNMYQSINFPFMLADTDRLALLKFKNGKKKLVGLECKTTYNTPSITAWKDGLIPPTYEAQCRHYMAVTQLSAWYICCCWGLSINDCAISLIRRDMDKETELIESEKGFIKCCEEGIEPAIPEENAELATQYYNAVYGGLKNEEVRLDVTPENLAIFKEAELLTQKKAELKALTDEVDNLANKIAAELIKLSNGTGTSFTISENGEDVTKIGLTVPMKKDSIDLNKLKVEKPAIYEELKEVGIQKITKTDLTKIKENGKKIDASPYIVAGGVNIDKPIYVGEVKTFKVVAS